MCAARVSRGNGDRAGANHHDKHTPQRLPERCQGERWEREAEAAGYDSLSKFIRDHVEAGLKKFDRTAASTPDPAVDPNVDELRRQLADARAENDRLRRLKREAENAATEREAVFEEVLTAPGITADELKQHVTRTVPLRMPGHLRALQSDRRIRLVVAEEDETERFYPGDRDDGPVRDGEEVF